jgi:hypothetical protein
MHLLLKAKVKVKEKSNVKLGSNTALVKPYTKRVIL